eukprot:SAG22_NODE_395_length_11139_cov_14.562500_8_plen_230_part_00
MCTDSEGVPESKPGQSALLDLVRDWHAADLVRDCACRPQSTDLRRHLPRAYAGDSGRSWASSGGADSLAAESLPMLPELPNQGWNPTDVSTSTVHSHAGLHVWLGTFDCSSSAMICAGELPRVPRAGCFPAWSDTRPGGDIQLHQPSQRGIHCLPWRRHPAEACARVRSWCLTAGSKQQGYTALGGPATADHPDDRALHALPLRLPGRHAQHGRQFRPHHDSKPGSSKT